MVLHIMPIKLRPSTTTVKCQWTAHLAFYAKCVPLMPIGLYQPEDHRRNTIAQESFAPLTRNEEGRKELTVLRSRPTPTQFPTNIPYTQG